MTVSEFIQEEIDRHHAKMSALVEILNDIAPSGLGELESDSILIYPVDSCDHWLLLADETHKDLGVRLATLADQSGRFRVYGTTRIASFENIGPFYRVELRRSNPKCRKVQVLRPAKEIEMEICGDIPEGYTLLKELDVPA